MQVLKSFNGFILNTRKWVVDLTNISPRQFIAGVFSRKTFDAIVGQFYNPDHSDELKSLSAALGVFIGIMPIWGFQTIAAIFLAVTLKLNKPLVLLFAQVSFPPLMPLVMFLSYRTGRLWIASASAGANSTHQIIDNRLEQYLYGSITLAVAAAIATGLITYASLRLIETFRRYKLAIPLKKAA